ncbi:MAG: hypothetical protein PHO41_01070 [Eubacteriales bacterium]|nr:hypothetical protein [Eubacteriales bacterium]
MEQTPAVYELEHQIIRDQTALNGAPGSFGRRGSIQKNACGAVAAYNVGRMLECPASFEDILHNVVAASRFVRFFGGRLGVWPGLLRRYFKSRGLKATRFMPYRRAKAGRQAYVALYLHGSLFKGTLGAHYVTLRAQDGKYTAYNDIYGSYVDFLDMYVKTKARMLWVMGVDKDDEK